MIFVCPKCRTKLNIKNGAAVCERGHSHDISKEGYVNLLLGRGGLHGDNAEMVRARREFLSRGFYYPLAKLVGEMVSEYAPTGLAVLDSGSGEGYYTEAVYRALWGDGKERPVIGFDISKDAVKRASKRERGIGFAVASAYDMPLCDGSVGMVYNVFSPLATDEVLRVLAPCGYFLMAIPAEEHLFGLKERIYDTPYKNTVGSKELRGFRLVREEELRFTISLDSPEDIRNLFMMTPYAYRTSSVGRERVFALNSLQLEAHFLLLLYRKL